MRYLALCGISKILPLGRTVAADLAVDGGGAAIHQLGQLALAASLLKTDLDDGSLCGAEFVIGHGNTVPKWSGVALSFCDRPACQL